MCGQTALVPEVALLERSTPACRHGCARATGGLVCLRPMHDTPRGAMYRQTVLALRANPRHDFLDIYGGLSRPYLEGVRPS